MTAAISFLVLFGLTGCTKSVKWQEEVRLNTGQEIWVERTDTYDTGLAPGNPLSTSLRLRDRAIAFERGGRRYHFQTETLDIHMLQDTNLGPTIVAWSDHCGKPGYAEFRWLNERWKLQPSVDASLIGGRRNLIEYYSAVNGDIPAKVDLQFKQKSTLGRAPRVQDNLLRQSRIAANCSEGQ